jgi:hypothetical protein
MDEEYLNELTKLKQNLGHKKKEDEEMRKVQSSITDSVSSIKF